MNKARIGCVFAVAVVLGVFVWFYYRGAEKREARERADAEKTRIKETRKQTVKELAGRHNAILDWAGVRQRKQGAERVFTFELQDVLQKHGDTRQTSLPRRVASRIQVRGTLQAECLQGRVFATASRTKWGFHPP